LRSGLQVGGISEWEEEAGNRNEPGEQGLANEYKGAQKWGVTGGDSKGVRVLILTWVEQGGNKGRQDEARQYKRHKITGNVVEWQISSKKAGSGREKRTR